MIRTPALKTQVAILKDELKKQGITLKHAAALEIVALQNGFKNWRHAVDGAGEETVEKPFVVRVVFGSEDTATYHDRKVDPATLDTYQEFAFATEAEKLAFLSGLDEGEGWLDYAIVTPPPGLADWPGLNGADPAPLTAMLEANGFKQDDSATSMFRRQLDRGYFQYVMFDWRRRAGDVVDLPRPCISMDCMDEDGEFDDEVYLGDDSLFFGETFEEALAAAMAQADELQERGNAILAQLGR